MEKCGSTHLDPFGFSDADDIAALAQDPVAVEQTVIGPNPAAVAA